MLPLRPPGAVGSDPQSVHALVVDTDPAVARSLVRALSALRSGWQIDSIASKSALVSCLSRARVDVLVADQTLLEADGYRLLAWVRARHPGVVCLIQSSHAESHEEDLLRRHAHIVLEKPTAPALLLEAAEQALARLVRARARRLT